MTTQFSTPFHPSSCKDCRDAKHLGFDFTMAFQPIIDIDSGAPYAFEALVRGVDGQGAEFILEQVNAENRYRFDQTCRIKAIELAVAYGMVEIPDCKLSINFLPNAVYRPETCIRATLEASDQFKFPADRLMFEVTEGERVSDTQHLKNIFAEYRKQGFTTAIDDFGSGYSGLNLLATFQPHVIKLDMELTRDIDSSNAKQAIVAGVLLTATRLGIDIIAEGIETPAELNMLRDFGVRYFQGFLFAKPATGHLPLAIPI
ncbi:EAL domain-containing protein [Iodobacter arcticus]|uniref:EAL domain-containing protein n=1 Tax=Iodobacter arcticus TaxID=590593 RepID=A0ABW2R1I1_9NEIS